MPSRIRTASGEVIKKKGLGYWGSAMFDDPSSPPMSTPSLNLEFSLGEASALLVALHEAIGFVNTFNHVGPGGRMGVMFSIKRDNREVSVLTYPFNKDPSTAFLSDTSIDEDIPF